MASEDHAAAEVEPTLEMDIARGALTISRYMSDRGLSGGVTS